MTEARLPAEQSNQTVHIPEQREPSSTVSSLESAYEAIFARLEHEKSTNLLSIEADIKDIPIAELARRLNDAATLHGTDTMHIISKEQGIGNYAITHSADVRASDILEIVATMLGAEIYTGHFTAANIALARLLNTDAKRSEVARFLKKNLQQINREYTHFAQIIALLRVKSEGTEQALTKFEDQFYDAEMLVNIYTLINV